MTRQNGSNGQRTNGKQNSNGKPGQRRFGQLDTNLIDRQPPFDLQAEQGLVGSIMLLPDVLDDVAMIIKPDNFYDDANRTLYQVLLDMHNDGRRIDSTLLVSKLKESGDFEGIGGAAYLSKIINAVPNAAHAKHYAEIVREKATLRNLIYSATVVLRDAYDDCGDVPGQLARAESYFAQAAEQSLSSLDAKEFSAGLLRAMEALDSRTQGNDPGIKSGIHGFDQATGGLRPGELTILGGRPSQGKSALSSGIAIHVAENNHGAVLFVSLEMNERELCDRALCAKSHVSAYRMRDGSINAEDRSRIVEASSRLSQHKLFIDDSPSRTVTEICASARRIKRKHGLLLLVIDYIQLVIPDNPKDNRQEQVARISRRLKVSARELQVPILCLAQLNRQVEASTNSRPRLSHLRESGAIEQDADNVMFVHRPLFYANERPEHGAGEKAEIILAKARNGPTRVIDMLWFGEWMTWENPAQQHHQDYADTGF